MILKAKNKIINYIKKHGWKTAITIFVFYLIRDVSLYILLPWFIAKRLF